MKTLLPIILSALIASPVLADITLIQDTLVNGVKSRTTMFIKGNKLRTDNVRLLLSSWIPPPAT